MSYLDCKVGDSVVCVNDDKLKPFVLVNKVYEITRITIEQNWSMNGDNVSIQINGFQFPFTRPDGKKATSFGAWRFRKLQTKKTDISIFTNMFNQTQLTNQIELAVKERMPENV